MTQLCAYIFLALNMIILWKICTELIILWKMSEMIEYSELSLRYFLMWLLFFPLHRGSHILTRANHNHDKDDSNKYKYWHPWRILSSTKQNDMPLLPKIGNWIQVNSQWMCWANNNKTFKNSDYRPASVSAGFRHCRSSPLVMKIMYYAYIVCYLK